ncbi:MAG: cation diffusion facilitator family transporter [Nitrospinaceae bacterium]
MPKLPPLSPGVKVTLIGAGANLALSVIKFIGGAVGHSTALIADALHSLSDLLTDAVVLATHKIGLMPADADHPYGHGRAETIGATIVGTVIILAGLWIGYDVWKVIESGSQRVPTWLAAAAAVFSIGVNEAIFRYTRIVGNQLASPALIANAWHHRSDAISSLAALAGILGAHLGYPVTDPLAGGIVALMIFKVGYGIFADGIRDLMDTGLNEEQTEKIQAIIDGIPEVIKFHNLRTRKIGGKILMDVHILVDTDLTVTEGHAVAERVRRKLINAFGSLQDVLVHVDAEEDDQIEPLYLSTRGDLNRMVDPVLEAANGKMKKTGMRIHHLKGRTSIDLYIRMEETRTLGEAESLVKDLKARLKSIPEIDDARIYLDVNRD